MSTSLARGLAALAVLLAISTGCKSSRDEELGPTLLLGRVSVAVIPGGSETVAIVPQ